MRILYHHRIASKDGQAVHIEEILHALQAQGHEVLLVGPHWMESRQFGFEGGSIARLKRAVPGAIYELMEFAYNAVAFVRILFAAWRFRPDVIYERYNLYFVAGLWAKRWLGLPLLLEVNAPLLEERGRFGGIHLPKLAGWTERHAWRRADAVLTVTAVLAGKIAEVDVPRERIHVIANGIDWSKFADVPATAAAKERLGIGRFTVLGFTGFMREWHGLQALVDLIAKRSDRYLLLVGDGPARPSIELRARELGVEDRVRITGIVARPDVATFVAAFDVALQPDVVEYASPLKLFEYLALARAVVAPDKANIREVLTHGVDALLFPAGDVEAMGEAIERLCESAELRASLGTRARAAIEQRDLTWAGNARRIVVIAQSLLDARKGGRSDPRHEAAARE